jgi:hypothetical protein
LAVVANARKRKAAASKQALANVDRDAWNITTPLEKALL